MKVLRANTPPELRESLAKKLRESEKLIKSNNTFSSAFGMRELRKLIDEQGNVSIESINERFAELGFSNEIVDFLDKAEAQVVILRLRDGIWQFLE